MIARDLGSPRTVLSDGTRLEDLFDGQRRRISARVFSDPEIFEWETERVFGRAWLFVGLESEIPEPGDYVVRQLAGDSVIVARDHAGVVNILLNRCTHRGTQLCVTDRGQAARFRCPYHGWLFNPDGRLEAMPQERDWLGPHGDKADYTMRTARVAIRGGLIFGTWDPDMPDFEEYLGDFAFYFDTIFCSTDDDLVVVGAPQRWSLPFNWKLGAENFQGDAYHIQTAHASIREVGIIPSAGPPTAVVGVDPRWGHGFFSAAPAPEPLPLELMLPWLPPEVLPQLEQHLTPDQLRLLRHGGMAQVATLFPNLSWLACPFFFFIRCWQPVGPGEIELRSWALVHPDATEERRRAQDRSHNLCFGMTGTFEQDDAVIWSRIQRMHESRIGSREPVSYACSHGRPDKAGLMPDGGAWPGPGDVWHGFPSDDHLWNWHTRWLHLMTGGDL